MAWEASDVCEPFRVQCGTAVHTVSVFFAEDTLVPPEGAVHFDGIYRLRDNGRFYFIQDPESRFATFACREGHVTRLYLAQGYKGKLSARMIFESIGLFDLLAEYEMLILHSSYIVTRDGEGLLFCGPSGVGKSTQAELWRKYAEAEVINGDRALINTQNGTVYGILYSGTSKICKNASAPLRAIVLPVQANENRVYKLRPQEKFMRIMNQCAYYTWAQDSAERMTYLVAQLVGIAEIYGMDCRKDEDAVHTLEQYLKGAEHGI